MRFSRLSRSRLIFLATRADAAEIFGDALRRRLLVERAVVRVFDFDVERDLAAGAREDFVFAEDFFFLAEADLANRTRARINWSFRIECQPDTPWSRAIWPRSLTVYSRREVAVIKGLSSFCSGPGTNPAAQVWLERHP